MGTFSTERPCHRRWLRPQQRALRSHPGTSRLPPDRRGERRDQMALWQRARHLTRATTGGARHVGLSASIPELAPGRGHGERLTEPATRSRTEPGMIGHLRGSWRYSRQRRGSLHQCRQPASGRGGRAGRQISAGGLAHGWLPGVHDGPDGPARHPQPRELSRDSTGRRFLPSSMRAAVLHTAQREPAPRTIPVEHHDNGCSLDRLPLARWNYDVPARGRCRTRRGGRAGRRRSAATGRIALKTIGLLGGMSWESSIIYERIINEEVRRC